MISGTFHTTAQEWRYFSREKALIHTAHFAQLPTGIPGDPVFIPITPPTGVGGGGGSFHVGTGTVPSITPYRNLTYAGTTGYMVSPWFSGFIFGTFPSQGAHPGLFRSWDINAQAQGYSNVADSAWGVSLSGTCEPQGDPGGAILMTYGHRLVFQISFGTSIQPAPESWQGYAFVADPGLPEPPNQFGVNYPPPNMQQIAHGDQIMQEDLNGGNYLWQSNLEVVWMMGGYLQPSDHMILVDNISFPHQGLQGKILGAGSWIGLGALISPISYTDGTYIQGFKVGPMNLLNGPNWIGQ